MNRVDFTVETYWGRCTVEPVSDEAHTWLVDNFGPLATHAQCAVGKLDRLLRVLGEAHLTACNTEDGLH